MNKETKTVLVLSLIIYLVMTGVTIISPVLPRYAEELGASIPMIGVLVGSFAAARVVLSLPAGIIGDRIGNKTTMSIGLVIIIVSSVIAYSAFNYYVLLLARIFEGIGSAFYATMSTSYLAKNTKIEHRGRFMGIFVGALLLGQVSGPGIGGVVAVNYGYAAPFLFYAIITSIGLTIHIWLIAKDKAVPKEELAKRDIGAEIKKVLSNRSFIIVNAGTLAAFFARGGIIATIFPIMADKNFGLDAGMIGLILTGVAVTSLATMLPAGFIADRYGRKLPFTASMILGGISALFIPLAEDVIGLSIAMLVFGLSLGLSGPMAAWAADLSDPKMMGTAMGVYRTIGDAGFILGPVILTAVVTISNSDQITAAPFVVCFFWLIITGFLLLKAEDPAGKRPGVGPVV
jgi:MFS family permease